MGKSRIAKRSVSSVIKKIGGIGKAIRNPVTLSRRLTHGQTSNTSFARGSIGRK